MNAEIMPIGNTVVSGLTCDQKTLSKRAHRMRQYCAPSKQTLEEYFTGTSTCPYFIHGNAIDVLKTFPSGSIDCCITSPPYWGKRQYDAAGIGLEEDYRDFIRILCDIFFELKRVLRNTGSLWLNLGDTYRNKKLLGIPWRVALELMDVQGWVLRNEVIWDKVKGGPDNAQDKLGNVHETVFHFVKDAHGYYYDVDSIRTTPKKAKVINGAIVSATGVSGVRYKRQIELSTVLNETEKSNALSALNDYLAEVREGKLADFRMLIRGQQRTTHSDSVHVSGRAKELRDRGFYFLKYHPNGSKPRDVWEILPEDTQQRDAHYAPFPEDLCKIPILATCPESGIVLDPFAGTGTAMLVAMNLGRKSIGIDTCSEYLDIASQRCTTLF
jgi:site-specific DNA-methyltransferase (adenine-specific)